MVADVCVGVILYTRDRVSASFARWADEHASPEADTRALKTLFHDVTSQTRRVDFPVDANSDGGDTLRKAVAHLQEQGRMDHITIAGYGPFVPSLTGQGDIQAVTAVAHAPFTSVRVREIVRKRARCEAHEVSLITDVSAMAIARYWATWLGRRGAAHDLPNVVAALIVEEGIGGAVAQSGGEIVGQNHHAEMGHIPVTPHKDDKLRNPRCSVGHANCLMAFASLPAAYERVRLFRKEAEVADPWEIQAHYLAQFCATIVHFVAATEIAIGGDLIEEQPHLIEKVRAALPGMVTGMPYAQLADMQRFVTGIDRYNSMLVGGAIHGLKQVQGGSRARGQG